MACWNITGWGPNDQSPPGDEWPVEVHTTPQGRLHRDNGPALVMANGEEFYFLEGVRVPKEVVIGEITKEMISSEQNQEVRRTMIERVGGKRFAEMFDVEALSEDKHGTIVRFNDLDSGEYEDYYWNGVGVGKKFPYIAVRVTDPSTARKALFGVGRRKEGREYYLRVPGRFENKTPRAAVAWTFGMTEKQYKPVKET